MGEKTRYSDEELQEFKALILGKLEKARQDYVLYKNASSENNNFRHRVSIFPIKPQYNLSYMII